MPELNLDDTIAAVATPPGEGGIAVIRVSGKEAIRLVENFFDSSKIKNLRDQATHTIHHGFFSDDQKERIDEVLIHLFKSPHSFTGQDVVEISCHGGTRIARRILETLIQQGARPAEPGEFTRRAFLNGKIDLTQAEAVLDLIRAKSDASLEAALSQLQGKLSGRIQGIKESLLKVSAHLEASLDFPDERLEVFPREECLKKMEQIQNEIKSLLGGFERTAALREGLLTVIVGRPNVGKSSLLNALLERDRALVSAIPGTTRDGLEETLEIAGFPVRLVDTAGLRYQGPKVPGTFSEDTFSDELDRLAIRKTESYLDEGKLFLFVIDGSSGWTQDDEMIYSKLHAKNFLVIVNKSDLPRELDWKEIKLFELQKRICSISCRTGDGLEELEKMIEQEILKTDPGESLVLTRLRHKLAVERAFELLAASRRTLEQNDSIEFAQVDLKAAIDSLRELIGEVYSEDLLDVIFQEFCIGK